MSLALAMGLLMGCDDETPAGSDTPDMHITEPRLDGEVTPVDSGGLDAGRPDAQSADAAIPDAVSPDAEAAAPLNAEAGPSRSVDLGAEVILDASDSTGAVAYQWQFGDGRGQAEPGPNPVATVIYNTPGRHRATLTVFGPEGQRRTDTTLITVTRPPAFAPRQSDLMATLPDGRLAVAVPDASAVALIERPDLADPASWTLQQLLPAPSAPRTLTFWPDEAQPALVASCPDTDELVFWLFEGRLPDQAPLRTELPLEYGAQPFGVVGAEDGLYVTLQGPGALQRITHDPSTGRFVREPPWPAVKDARGVALLPDGRVAVSRWRSSPEQAEIAVLTPGAPDAPAPAETWTLARDPQRPSDTEIGGVPSYLDPLVVSPQGDLMVVPSLQANLGHGLALDGEAPLPDTVLRGVASFVDLPEGVERFERRKQFDSRGFASAAAFSPRGDFLYVTTRGSQSVERIDLFGDNQSGSAFLVGYTPESLFITPDNRFLVVYPTLSRVLQIYDLADWPPIEPTVTVPVVETEPLDPVLLRGKQLFNDSADPRLSDEGYIACAHCHLDGDSDHQVWDFTDRGEGLRNTTTLLGRAGAGHGPIHWSGNFDEIQDFEHDIRGPFGGEGLMEDADFEAEGRDHPMGAPKAGSSADLDALAAYVSALQAYRRSPFRAPDGGLTEAALRGQQLFESEALGCTPCHNGPHLTDSGFIEPGQPRLHDVGTLRPTSGQRLGGPLNGIDTPTLHGLWHSAPYLHDGSAPSLRAVLIDRNPDDAHGRTTQLTDPELSDLEAYLLSLDGP